MRETAGPVAWLRKATLAQAFNSQTAAVVAPDGRTLAVGFFRPGRAREMRFALAIRPEAAGHMRQLIRLAHLTLAKIADTGLIVTTEIHPDNSAGQRMARLTGFRPGRPGTAKTLWVWRQHGTDLRRR